MPGAELAGTELAGAELAGAELLMDMLEVLVIEAGLLDEDDIDDIAEDDEDAEDCADVLDGAEDVVICVMVAEEELAALDATVAAGSDPHPVTRAAVRAAVAMTMNLGARVLMRRC